MSAAAEDGSLPIADVCHPTHACIRRHDQRARAGRPYKGHPLSVDTAQYLGGRLAALHAHPTTHFDGFHRLLLPARHACRHSTTVSKLLYWHLSLPIEHSGAATHGAWLNPAHECR